MSAIFLLACSSALQAAEEEHGYEEDILAVFIGGARDHRDNGPALGLEYEHRFTANFGLGALVEHTFGSFNTWVFAFPLAYHEGPWKLYAGPGLEKHKGESTAMVRLGVEYGFHFENWEIAPQVDFDFVGDEKVFVLGVTFARGF